MSTVWGNYQLERRMEIGHVGRRGTGTKIHVVRSQYIVGVIDVEAELKIAHPTLGQKFLRSSDSLGDRVPVLFSADAPCNGNGQRIARPINELTPETFKLVTCERCLARVVRPQEVTK